MNEDVKNITEAGADAGSSAGNTFVPLWLTGLLGVLVYWGCNYVDSHGGKFNPLVYAPYKNMNELARLLPADEAATQIRLGEQVYMQNCVACHQPTGGGAVGIAPPLAGSEWVNGGVGKLIRIPLKGLTGPITVKGEQYNLSMLSFEALLPDEQIAAALTYIRTAWGNNGSRITTEQVRKVRQQVAGQEGQFTVSDLEKVPAE